MKAIKTLLLLWMLCMSAQAFGQENTLQVWTDPVHQVTADGETVTYVTVCQKDPNANYTTFNAALIIPKGMQIHKVKQGRDYVNDIQLSERATNTHTIACNMPDERTLKVICMSSELLELYPDNENGNEYYPLFTVGLIADPTTYNGNYQVELFDCIFVKREEVGLSWTELDHTEYSEFKVTGGTDFPGIDYAMSSLGWGTLMLPFDSQIPEGLNAYECEGASEDNVLMLKQVESFAANTPYIVSGKEGTYHFNGEYKGLKESYSTDYMTGVFEEMQVPAGAYVMQNHAATLGVGFYKVGETEVTISPYRCYLKALPNSANALRLPMDELTGISTSEIDGKQKVNVYNAEGKLVRSGVKSRKALENLEPGVYIINNQKYLKY